MIIGRFVGMMELLAIGCYLAGPVRLFDIPKPCLSTMLAGVTQPFFIMLHLPCVSGRLVLFAPNI